MKKIILLFTTLFLCTSVFAQGWMELIKGLAIDETNYAGIEVILEEMKGILNDTKRIQSQNIGNDADVDVYRKLAQFYAEMEKNSIETIKALWDFGIEAAQNGGDQEFWEMKASEFAQNFKASGKIPGTNYTIADVTRYIKLKGISKEAKMNYIDDIVKNMQNSSRSQLYRSSDEYFAYVASKGMKEANTNMIEFITDGEDEAEREASEAVNDLKAAKGTTRKVIGFLLIGLCIGSLAWNIRKYFKGNQDSENIFIRVIIGAVIGFVGLAVLFM